MKISQLADDTTLFLKDESQVSKALDLIYNCSCASGLKLNVSKCEIMPVHDLNNDSIENIPIKSTVKYLDIYINKNLLARQHLNFSSRIVKSKIFLIPGYNGTYLYMVELYCPRLRVFLILYIHLYPYLLRIK